MSVVQIVSSGAAYGVAESLIDALSIFRNDPGKEVLAMLLERPGSHAEDPERLLRPMGGIRANVPLPGAEAGQALGGGQLRLALQQRLLGPLTLRYVPEVPDETVDSAVRIVSGHVGAIEAFEAALTSDQGHFHVRPARLMPARSS